jgi:hypothetical protein
MEGGGRAAPDSDGGGRRERREGGKNSSSTLRVPSAHGPLSDLHVELDLHNFFAKSSYLTAFLYSVLSVHISTHRFSETMLADIGIHQPTSGNFRLGLKAGQRTRSSLSLIDLSDDGESRQQARMSWYSASIRMAIGRLHGG